MAIQLTRDVLRRLARLGAERRLEELQQEAAAIRAAFPDLEARHTGRGRRRGRPRAASASPAVAAEAAKPKRRKRRPMTAAQKRAVSERMKRYWAERRKARG